MTAAPTFVDVGTHDGQEFRAILDHRRIAYLDHYLRHRRRARRAGQAPLSYARFSAFLSDAARLRAERPRIRYVMVKPNARLFARPVYRLADHAFNIALSAEPATCAVRPLFFARNDPLGQGSSLFTEKPNVNTGDFDLVLNVDALHFAQVLDAALGSRGLVVLRINNEGAEAEVIHAFHQTFGRRFVSVMGSLSDVAKVKGEGALRDLHGFLEAEGIPFVPLHSDFRTWPDAVAHLLGLMTQA